ncbi:MAG: polyprenyl synthetase family protein [Saprospiraceae bacterium]|nr:polyprenyl synthetase family protein [Bacteroidia bacterium]MBT8230671.1 polyprenyl synthetase family protein [Bacteroidia bacterium]NNF21135.1 polyprenyl synthetase family protein [Saprospiraceae bacterium]NNK88997.1 polyprenyl synthetase family protein [Saprospiraceae bacterium]
MYSFKELSKKFNDYLSEYSYPDTPAHLYEPVKYIMSLGGKRIRPSLVLASRNLFGDDIEYAFEAAMAVEVFHNFSLVHDDIMDEAAIRRGKEATHIAYDTNSAILSGDVMLIMSYRILEKYKSSFFRLMKLFSRTAQEVCDGQRMDMDFEELQIVSIEDYIKMITLKTSVLIAAALGLGGIISNASNKDIEHLYEFGKNMGIAFQIQDDILDSFGDQELVGKKIGGDIIQKKKTYLYLKALELLSEKEAERLKRLFVQKDLSDDELVQEVMDLYKRAHVLVHAQELKLVYHQLALSHLDAISIENDRKKILRDFSNELLSRQF